MTACFTLAYVGSRFSARCARYRNHWPRDQRCRSGGAQTDVRSAMWRPHEHTVEWSWGSSVGIVTRLRAGMSGI